MDSLIEQQNQLENYYKSEKTKLLINLGKFCYEHNIALIGFVPDNYEYYEFNYRYVFKHGEKDAYFLIHDFFDDYDFIMSGGDNDFAEKLVIDNFHNIKLDEFCAKYFKIYDNNITMVIFDVNGHPRSIESNFVIYESDLNTNNTKDI